MSRSSRPVAPQLVALTAVHASRGESARSESDRWIMIMILVVGMIRPIQAMVRHEHWGAEAVLGLLMAVFAARALLVDLIVDWSRRRRG